MRSLRHTLKGLFVVSSVVAMLAFGASQDAPTRASDSFAQQDSPQRSQPRPQRPTAGGPRVQFVILYDENKTPQSQVRELEQFFNQIAPGGVLQMTMPGDETRLSEEEKSHREFSKRLAEAVQNGVPLTLFFGGISTTPDYHGCPPGTRVVKYQWKGQWYFFCVPQKHYHERLSNTNNPIIIIIIGDELTRQAQNASPDWWQQQVFSKIERNRRPVVSLKIEGERVVLMTPPGERIQFVILYDPNETPQNQVRELEQFFNWIAPNGVLRPPLNGDDARLSEDERRLKNLLVSWRRRNGPLLPAGPDCIPVWFHIHPSQPCPPGYQRDSYWVYAYNGQKPLYEQFFCWKCEKVTIGFTGGTPVVVVLGERLSRFAMDASPEWWQQQVASQIGRGRGTTPSTRVAEGGCVVLPIDPTRPKL